MMIDALPILRILPEANAEGTWAWLFLEAESPPLAIATITTLENALPSGKNLIILLPSSFLTLCTVQLPTQQAAQVLRALPYALEDKLAEEVEQLHLAPGRHLGAGCYPVLAIRQEKMQEIAALFQSIPVQLLTADLLALPWAAGHISLFADDQVFWLRSDAYRGCVLPKAEAESWFNALLPSLGSPEDLEIHYYYHHVEHELLPPLPPAWQAQAKTHPIKDRYSFWRQGLGSAGTISLLSGGYQRKPRWQQKLKQWRMALVFFSISMVLLVVNVTFDTWRLQKEVEALESQSVQIFRETFPNLQRVVNPRVQMEAELNTLRRSQGVDNNFLQLLTVLAQEKSNDIKLLSLHFRQQVLEIEVLLPNVQAAENLRNRLSKQGIQVAIRNVIAEQNQVRARLRLES